MVDAQIETTPARRLRRDAVENRQRILLAARDLLSERGLEVSLDDIARHAGVGIATFYRRFGSREELLEELFQEGVMLWERIFLDALACRDPWEGISQFIHRSVDLMTHERALWDLAFRGPTADADHEAVERQAATYLPRLVDRAQRAGVLRKDLRAADISVILQMLRASLDLTDPVLPGATLRYVALLLDALPPSRDTTSRLPVRAFTIEELDRAYRQL
jgi:AcrR family transcriptional regulator